MINDQLEAIILAILVLAKGEGRGKILRTVLIKFLYLVDVYAAEASSGKETLTNLEWTFLHYGPYSERAAKAIEGLAKRGMLVEEIIGAEFSGDKEYKLYSLPDYSSPKSLSDLGAPPRVKLMLSSDMKRYDKLSSLLNYVYFNTAPMRDAKPGDILNFKDCIKPTVAEFKVIQMKPLNKKKIAENKGKLRELIEKRKAQASLSFTGEYDEVYEKGMAALEEEPLPEGLKGRAFLDIK